MAHVQIFLSTVSAEFRSYRDALSRYLDRPNVTVKAQEDFIATGTETLDKLDEYIRQCHAVIHLVGDMTGALAQPPSVAVIRQRYPDLARRLPVLSPFLDPGAPALSYTQWEAWLALYHGKVLLVAVPLDDAPRDERYQLVEDQRAAQQDHLKRLATVDRYPEIPFANAERLALDVLRSNLHDILALARGVTKPANLPYLSIDRQNTLARFNIPGQVGVSMLILTLLLASSPWLGGTDWGFFKIPELPQQLTSILKYVGPVLFVIAIILHLPFWQQNGKEKASNVPEHKLTDPTKEKAICLKAEAEFQILVRRFNALPIYARTTEIEEQIKGQYKPCHVLKSSINIRIEHYILPLVSELIKIESDLRSKHRVPFSQARIAVIKDKIRAVVEQNWYFIVTAAREEAISHVVHHMGNLHEYKETELSNRRDELLATGPHEHFVIIDELLQKALADSILLAD